MLDTNLVQITTVIFSHKTQIIDVLTAAAAFFGMTAPD